MTLKTGAVRNLQRGRVHAGARDWNNPATDFWITATHADDVTASGATNLAGLDSYGWVTTSLGIVVPGGGDLLSLADSDPTYIETNASADALRSPRIFGDYGHGLVAASLLGYAPTKLILEARAQFSTASADEATSFIGLTGLTATDATGAGVAGAIVSDGTNFRLRSTNGNDAGAAIDTSWHTWRITYGAATTEWFIDGVSQGTITTEADLWGQCLTMIVGTTNRLRLAWAHLWYE